MERAQDLDGTRESICCLFTLGLTRGPSLPELAWRESVFMSLGQRQGSPQKAGPESPSWSSLCAGRKVLGAGFPSCLLTPWFSVMGVHASLPFQQQNEFWFIWSTCRSPILVGISLSLKTPFRVNFPLFTKSGRSEETKTQ